MEIPEEVARAEGVPEDLDSSVLGPFTVPSLTRRRRAGLFYLGGAVLVALAIAAGLPARMWIVVGLLVVIGAYHFLAAFELGIREKEALSIANQQTEFPVGHASAALGFVGWRSRPVWNVLVFSADEPPTERGLVRINAVSGKVEDVYVETNPEGP
ncbi:MAG: PepSY domain-containing protein [Akkermansiaceae bacterium]|nr:PepSY domain-containing protein [Akkermansiaceae bacterium]